MRDEEAHTKRDVEVSGSTGGGGIFPTKCQDEKNHLDKRVSSFVNE